MLLKTILKFIGIRLNGEPTRGNVLEEQIRLELGVIPRDLDTIETAINRLTEILIIARRDNDTFETASEKAGELPFHPWVPVAIQSAMRVATLRACLSGGINSIYPEAIAVQDLPGILKDAIALLEQLPDRSKGEG